MVKCLHLLLHGHSAPVAAWCVSPTHLHSPSPGYKHLLPEGQCAIGVETGPIIVAGWSVVHCQAQLQPWLAPALSPAAKRANWPFSCKNWLGDATKYRKRQHLPAGHDSDRQMTDAGMWCSARHLLRGHCQRASAAHKHLTLRLHDMHEPFELAGLCIEADPRALLRQLQPYCYCSGPDPAICTCCAKAGDLPVLYCRSCCIVSDFAIQNHILQQSKYMGRHPGVAAVAPRQVSGKCRIFQALLTLQPTE